MPIDPALLVAFTLTTMVAMITPGPDMLFSPGLWDAWRPSRRPARDRRRGDQ